MDRPVGATLLNKLKNKEFVQPQYVADSINNLFLLPTSAYRPGVPPPPHLSPFIDNVKEGYVPTRQKEIMHLKGEEVVESDEEDSDMAEEVKPAKAKPKQTTNKGDADSSDEEGNDA
jgi:pescadillo protein